MLKEDVNRHPQSPPPKKRKGVLINENLQLFVHCINYVNAFPFSHLLQGSHPMNICCLQCPANCSRSLYYTMTGNLAQSVIKSKLTIYTLGNLVYITAWATLAVYIQHKGALGI